MKKSLITILVLLLLILSACTAEGEQAAKIPEKDEASIEPVAPSTPDTVPNATDTSPADIPSTPSDTDNDSSLVPSSPSNIANLSKIYSVANEVGQAAESSCKQWMDSLGGLPGFTISGKYDTQSGNYILSDGMGGFEAIEKIYVCNLNITVQFRDYVMLHKWMTDIPDYIAINSSKVQGVTPDGYEYTSTVYAHSFNGIGELATDNGRITLTFTFDKPIIIDDFYISCGKVD
ncbi:MAG: hypothetical protein IKM67_02355 [Clostridia bacterium]|nr:hypothetical protein [Clostridia bacterium]